MSIKKQWLFDKQATGTPSRMCENTVQLFATKDEMRKALSFIPHGWRLQTINTIDEQGKAHAEVFITRLFCPEILYTIGTLALTFTRLLAHRPIRNAKDFTYEDTSVSYVMRLLFAPVDEHHNALLDTLYDVLCATNKPVLGTSFFLAQPPTDETVDFLNSGIHIIGANTHADTLTHALDDALGDMLDMNLENGGLKLTSSKKKHIRYGVAHIIELLGGYHIANDTLQSISMEVNDTHLLTADSVQKLIQAAVPIEYQFVATDYNAPLLRQNKCSNTVFGVCGLKLFAELVSDLHAVKQYYLQQTGKQSIEPEDVCSLLFIDAVSKVFPARKFNPQTDAYEIDESFVAHALHSYQSLMVDGKDAANISMYNFLQLISKGSDVDNINSVFLSTQLTPVIFMLGKLQIAAYMLTTMSSLADMFMWDNDSAFSHALLSRVDIGVDNILDKLIAKTNGGQEIHALQLLMGDHTKTFGLVRYDDAVIGMLQEARIQFEAGIDETITNEGIGIGISTTDDLENDIRAHVLRQDADEAGDKAKLDPRDYVPMVTAMEMLSDVMALKKTQAICARTLMEMLNTLPNIENCLRFADTTVDALVQTLSVRIQFTDDYIKQLTKQPVLREIFSQCRKIGDDVDAVSAYMAKTVAPNIAPPSFWAGSGSVEMLEEYL